MHKVIMPKLGLDMTAGTIEKWHKQPGDVVEAGEILFEVMTDKVSLEVEAYNSGTLLKIVRKEGDEVPVTEVIAYIGEPGEQVPDTQEQTGEATRERTVKISPIARRLAQEKGVDFRDIAGTGPGGRIVKEDIENALEQGGPGSSGDNQIKEKSRKPLSGVRKIIARRLTESQQNIPHVFLEIVVDAQPLLTLKEQEEDNSLTVTDYIIKAAATVLTEQPVINASLSGQDHVVYEDVNVGIAVSSDDGLIVPTIFRADRMSLQEIETVHRDLVTKAREGGLTTQDVSNGTFTISNLGMYGIRSFTAIINPPQGAILMVGEIYEAPAVVDGRVSVGSFMQISIAVDHRIIDGADAARFLGRLKELLQAPEQLKS